MNAAQIDLYQLTSLIPHWAAGRADDAVTMAFFSRRLPRTAHDKQPARGYLLWTGLQRCLDHLEHARFTDDAIEGLCAHPVLGPALRQYPKLIERLRTWQFTGEIHSPAEGTPLFAGRAVRMDGSEININGVRPAAYCPYLVVHTDLLSAKLIETPLLSVINHMTMVGTKASIVSRAARQIDPTRAVLEFGSRRTHPEAAQDAALAAYLGGAAATSNVAAHLRYGIPMSGTMDHFAIQSWEQPGVPRHQTERAYFEAFHQSYPDKGILLVDTYDTFGDQTGIRSAVAATNGGPWGIRIDSALTVENICRARTLLDSLGATHTKIFVSGGMDEHSITALGEAPVDGYGVGERIVTSPDAPVGVGAVGKLCMVRGEPSMKLSRGSGKATLPGTPQVWRTTHGDVVGLHHEQHPGTTLLQPVWTRQTGRLDSPSIHDVRDHAISQVEALTDEQRTPQQVTVRVTDALAALIHQGVEAAS